MARLITSVLLGVSLVNFTVSTNRLRHHTKARQVKVAGEELLLSCDLQPDLGGLIVWKHGARVLFAGDLRIRRDGRLSLQDGR